MKVIEKHCLRATFADHILETSIQIAGNNFKNENPDTHTVLEIYVKKGFFATLSH